jgi:hypothetical protein
MREVNVDVPQAESLLKQRLIGPQQVRLELVTRTK